MIAILYNLLSPSTSLFQNKIVEIKFSLFSNTDYLNKNSKGNLIILKHYVYSV